MVRPYPGTRPFQRQDSDRFFGRRREAAALAELWRTNSLTVAVGPTGSGKTSLIHAGLLPLVESGRAEVLPPGRVSYGSTIPAAALPEHNPYTVALLGSWSPGESTSRLVGRTLRDDLRERTERHDGLILAVIDQAEELLADSGPRRIWRRQLLEELAEAVRQESRLHLLLCIRDSAAEEFSAVLGHGAQCRVGPLSFDAALAAVTGPAEAAGLGFGPGAAEEFVTDLLTSTVGGGPTGSEWPATDDSVPPVIVQVACARLWESLPPNLDVITKRDVRNYGDVDAALGAYSSQVIAAVADEHDVPQARLRSWLIRIFVNDLGRRGTAYEGMTSTAGMPNSMARALEDRHLLISERRSGSRWYELLSERLIRPLGHTANAVPPPADGGEVLQLAGRALSLGDLDLAERYGRETLRVADPDDLRLQAEAQSLLGNLAHERGKPADAEIRYRQAAGLFETVRDRAAVACQLAAIGQTLLDQGRLTEAVTELRAAVDRLPSDPLLQNALGWAVWQLGQPRTAETIFTGVLAIDGGNAEALRGRGEVLADLGDSRGALRDLSRLASAVRPSARAARGLALAQLGQQAEAEDEIKTALTEVPHNGPVLLYAARAAVVGGDKAAAAELAERALTAADPSLPPHQRKAAQELTAC
jgi:tetratricopeptide (TPR) repeat protein